MRLPERYTCEASSGEANTRIRPNQTGASNRSYIPGTLALTAPPRTCELLRDPLAQFLG